MELRKAKKNDQLSKRRNLDVEPKLVNSLDEAAFSPTSALSLDEIVNYINSSNEMSQLIAIRTCRKLLSQDKNPPINDVIEGGIVPRCIELLDIDHKYVYL